MNANKSIEYFDVLDENGNKTGEIKTKEDVIADRGFYRIVNLWIINPYTKQILIQKRSSNKDVSPNKWDLTSGGHVEAGETSYEGILKAVFVGVVLTATSVSITVEALREMGKL